MELENDRFDNNDTDTDSNETIDHTGTDTETGDTTNTGDDTADNSVPDSMGDDYIPPADTETPSDSSPADSETIPETGLDNPESFTETNTDDSQGGYEITVEASELEYIEYLLNTQIDDFQTVKDTVSGNSVNITLDTGTKETLTAMETNQRTLIDGQNALLLLLSCVLLALVFDFMSRSAKRVIKGFMDKQ